MAFCDVPLDGAFLVTADSLNLLYQGSVDSSDSGLGGRDPVDLIDWVQWPAMVVTVISAWFIGSQQPRRRMVAFWGFILSNALWVIWGWHTNAFGLIVLECILLGMNARGFRKNQRGSQASE